MSLSRVQFKENYSIFMYIVLFFIVFGFLNVIRGQLEYKILLLMGIALGFTYYIYSNQKEKEKEKVLLDKGDLKLFDDINAPEFKDEQFFFDFFRKNYFIKELNKYTWLEIIRHCNNYIKIVKLMDSEIEDKSQLLDNAKHERSLILNLFSSIIVGIKPGTSNIDNTEDDILVLTKERDRLKDELDYYYGEMVKKNLLLWKNNKNIRTRPVMDEEVNASNQDINYNMDLY